MWPRWTVCTWFFKIKHLSDSDDQQNGFCPVWVPNGARRPRTPGIHIHWTFFFKCFLSYSLLTTSPARLLQKDDFLKAVPTPMSPPPAPATPATPATPASSASPGTPCTPNSISPSGIVKRKTGPYLRPPSVLFFSNSDTSWGLMVLPASSRFTWWLC